MTPTSLDKQSATHTRLHALHYIYMLIHTRTKTAIYLKMHILQSHPCTQWQEVHTVALCSHKENIIQSSTFNSLTEAVRHSFQQNGSTVDVSCLRRNVAEMGETPGMISLLFCSSVQVWEVILIMCFCFVFLRLTMVLFSVLQRPWWTHGWPQLNWAGQHILILGWVAHC